MILNFIYILLVLVVSCLCNNNLKILQPLLYDNGNYNYNVVFPLIQSSKTVIGSKPGSYSGLLYKISTNEDLTSFKMEDLVGKFAVVIAADLVNKSVLKDLQKTKKVVGVVIYYENGQDRTKNYSPDNECPNCEFGMYSDSERAKYKWNPHGDGLLYEQFDFPIFGILNSPNMISSSTPTILAITEADIFNKRKNYKEYPLYTIKFDSFMLASTDVETCLARKTCDPIGGHSVWGSFSKSIEPKDGKKIIIVNSQLDGNSLFHDNTIGSNSQIGGVVANLAIMDALSRANITQYPTPNHLIFMFFNGESYGYGGSQRFVKDISTTFECKNNKSPENNNCSKYASCFNPYMYFDEFKNITIDNIKGIIELNQLTCSGCEDRSNPTYYMHVDDETDPETLKLTNLISKVYNNSAQVKSNHIPDTYAIKPAWEGIGKNLGLPPASAQSFLKKKKIPTVVISDFQTEFTNKHYHSSFDVDDETTEYNNTVCRTADIIAKSLWLYAQNKEDVDTDLIQSVNVDCDYVNNLMQCLTNDISCPLAHTLLTSNNSTLKINDNIKQYSHYSGVFNKYSLNGTLHIFSSFDSWITNFSIIKFTGKNTTVPCKVIDDCLKLEYNNYDKLEDDVKNKIKSMHYSKRKIQCIENYCIEGQAYVHPAYGIGIDYNAPKDEYYIRDNNLPTWTESRWSSVTITITFTTSRIFQIFELFVGIICVALTILGYYYIKNYTRKSMKLA